MPRKFFMRRIVSLLCLFSSLVWSTAAQQSSSATFEMTVSLVQPSMHAADDLIFKVVTSNPTDHIVYAGEGVGNGVGVELLNEKGEDKGRCAMGGSKHVDSGIVLGPTRESLRPGSRETFTWHFKPDSGCLAPGTYRLRVYRRDIMQRIEVYSNAVMLAVLP